jgi:hypothetical protein
LGGGLAAQTAGAIVTLLPHSFTSTNPGLPGFARFWTPVFYQFGFPAKTGSGGAHARLAPQTFLQESIRRAPESVTRARKDRTLSASKKLSYRKVSRSPFQVPYSLGRWACRGLKLLRVEVSPGRRWNGGRSEPQLSGQAVGLAACSMLQSPWTKEALMTPP